MRESRDGASRRWLHGLDHLSHSILNRNRGVSTTGAEDVRLPRLRACICVLKKKKSSLPLQSTAVHGHSTRLRCSQENSDREKMASRGRARTNRKSSGKRPAIRGSSNWRRQRPIQATLVVTARERRGFREAGVYFPCKANS